ncbi:MAG: hypothetical protein FJ297_08335 [Planctomycetes bacterium]|nr:hypothetical protein [Planctomycetota bacterium]
MARPTQQFACPFCQGLFLSEPPEGGPVTVQCPHCGRAVLVAPMSASPGAPSASEPTVLLDTRVGHPSDPVVPAATVTLQPGTWKGPSTPAAEPATIHAADTMRTEISAVDDDAPGPDEVDERAGRSWIRGVAIGLVVTAALIVVWVVASQWNPRNGTSPELDAARGRSNGAGPSSDSNTPSMDRRESGSSANEKPVKEADASKASLRQGVYEVRIVRAGIGPILGRDASNAVVTLADECLRITLQVQNVSKVTVDYRGWYSESLREDGPVAAKLTDDRSRPYSLLEFGEGDKVQGIQTDVDLEPSRRVTDSLIFDVPSDLDRSSVRAFHLWLDGAAQGIEHPFRFRIPVDMIEGW